MPAKVEFMESSTSPKNGVPWLTRVRDPDWTQRSPPGDPHSHRQVWEGTTTTPHTRNETSRRMPRAKPQGLNSNVNYMSDRDRRRDLHEGGTPACRFQVRTFEFRRPALMRWKGPAVNWVIKKMRRDLEVLQILSVLQYFRLPLKAMCVFERRSASVSMQYGRSLGVRDPKR